MFVKRSSAAVTKFVKRLINDLLDLNWNDHTLAEIGTTQSKRSSNAVESDDM